MLTLLNNFWLIATPLSSSKITSVQLTRVTSMGFSIAAALSHSLGVNLLYITIKLGVQLHSGLSLVSTVLVFILRLGALKQQVASLLISTPSLDLITTVHSKCKVTTTWIINNIKVTAGFLSLVLINCLFSCYSGYHLLVLLVLMATLLLIPLITVIIVFIPMQLELVHKQALRNTLVPASLSNLIPVVVLGISAQGNTMPSTISLNTLSLMLSCIIFLLYLMMLLAFLATAITELLVFSLSPSYASVTRDSDSKSEPLFNKTNKSIKSSAFGKRGLSTTSCSWRPAQFPPTWDPERYYKQVAELDVGQRTDNPFILLQRFMSTGAKPTPTILNTVLALPDNVSASQELLDWFDTITPTQFPYPINSSDKENMYRLRMIVGAKKCSVEKRTPGVYIVRRGKSCYVGGALHLNDRPWSHLKLSSTGSCPRWVRTYNKEGFVIDLYPLLNIPDFAKGYESENLTVMFEQYLTIIHRPDINHSLISNMTSPICTEEQLQAIRLRQGLPVYAYYNKVLSYKFSYLAEVGRLLGYTDSWCDSTLNKGGVVKDFEFTRNLLEGREEKLITSDEFLTLFKAVVGEPRKEPIKVAVYNMKTDQIAHYNSLPEAATACGIERPNYRLLLDPQCLSESIKMSRNLVFIKTVEDDSLMKKAYQYVREGKPVSGKVEIRVKLTRLSDRVSFTYMSMAEVQYQANIDLGIDWKPYWYVREVRLSARSNKPAVFSGIEVFAYYVGK